MKLLKYFGNWADEMNIYGIKIMTDDEFNLWVAGLSKFFDKRESWTWYIGTNEEIEFGSAAQLLSYMTIIDLKEDEADVFIKYLTKGNKQFGFFPDYSKCRDE